MPQIAMAWPRFSIGVDVHHRGLRQRHQRRAEHPCKYGIRPICISDCAAPHIIEVTVNPTRHVNEQIFSAEPRRQPTHRRVMIAAAVMYEVRTQVISSVVADRLPCIYGNATLAMV